MVPPRTAILRSLIICAPSKRDRVWLARSGGIEPSSTRRYNSQKLNSSSQTVMHVGSEPRSPRNGGTAVLKTFGDFEFDNRRRRLRARGQPVRLSGQGIDLLCLLLERPGELITREEIERRLWPDRSVNFDHSLDVVISRLRTVLGDRGPNPRYIETVPRSGYRFTEPVTPRPEARPAKAPRQWGGRLITYAAVAILAAIMAIVFARTRYGRFVPRQRSQASPTVPAR
jgi:DNA-binding winged helix-turn-helix (wHTH) protein